MESIKHSTTSILSTLWNNIRPDTQGYIFITLNAADSLITSALLSSGLAREANPFMASTLSLTLKPIAAWLAWYIVHKRMPPDKAHTIFTTLNIAMTAVCAWGLGWLALGWLALSWI